MTAWRDHPWVKPVAVAGFALGGLLTLAQLFHLAGSLASMLQFSSVLGSLDPLIGWMATSAFLTSIGVVASVFVAWRFLKARRYARMTVALALSGWVLPWLHWQVIGALARAFGPA